MENVEGKKRASHKEGQREDVICPVLLLSVVVVGVIPTLIPLPPSLRSSVPIIIAAV